MDSKQVKELMAVANESKNAGDYESANVVFAKIFSIFQGMDSYTFPDRGDAHLVPVLETDDRGGDCIAEVYYDLAVFSYSEDDGSVDLCIPVPLLSFYAALAFYKAAAGTMQDRHESDRAQDEETEEQAAIRKEKLSELLGDEIEYLKATYLDLSSDDEA